MKRRDLVELLLEAGFVSMGGIKLERFKKGSVTVPVKRRSVIADQAAKRI